MPWWPFGRRKKQDESFFDSTSGAQVAPEAPPGAGAPAAPPSSAATPSPSATPTSTPPGEISAPVSSVLPPAFQQKLAAAGIHLDPNAPVQISTKTTQLSGQLALQFLGQMSSFFGASLAGSVQMHPQVTIVSGGRIQASPEKLKTEGVDAQAKVVDLEDKLMLGDMHVVKLKLEIQRAGAEPYEVRMGAVVPASITEDFAEGKTFPAKVDPKEPNQVLVLWPGS